MRIEPIGVVIIIFTLGIILLFNYKKNNKLIIGFCIALLISNGFLFIKYSYLQTDINVTTWQSLTFLRMEIENIKSWTELNQFQKEVEYFDNTLENILEHVTILSVVHDNATFSRDSISKEEFEKIARKLGNIAHNMDSKEIKNNSKLRTELIELSKLLREIKGGPGDRRVFGPTRIIAEINDELYNKILNKLNLIQKLQYNSYKN